MAGGPILPSSVFLNDSAGRIFPNVYAGGGGNASAHDEGIGVVSSLSVDTNVELRFPVPPGVPTGTLKLRILALANATSGSAKLTVKDGTCPAGSSPSAVSLTSETQTTITWAAGDADKYKEAKVTLTASPAGNDVLVVTINFNSTGWTLAAIGTFLFSVIWE